MMAYPRVPEHPAYGNDCIKPIIVQEDPPEEEENDEQTPKTGDEAP